MKLSHMKTTFLAGLYNYHARSFLMASKEESILFRNVLIYRSSATKTLSHFLWVSIGAISLVSIGL